MKFSLKINIIIPALAFLLFAGITLIVWHNKNVYETKLIQKHTEITAEQIHIRIEGFLRARLASLDLLAEHWIERRPVDFSQKRFLKFAKNVYKHYPGYQAINWVNPDGIVCWVYPPESNIKAKGKNINRHPEPAARKTFEKAKTSGKYQISPVVTLFQGQQGFVACWSLVFEDKIQGYLNGVFSLDKIMDICLAEKVCDEFLVRIYENGRLIYHVGEGGSQENQKSSRQVEKKITFGKKVWLLEVESKAPLPGTIIFLFNVPVLFMGMFF